jgi:UDP-3-O-[3-hydroxymyristoyl] glucosamine N-acyltransferase
MKLSELIDEIGGEAEGDPSVEVTAVAEPETAGEGQLAWVGDDRYSQMNLRASVLLLSTDQALPEQHEAKAVWRHTQPNKAFALSIARLHPEPPPSWEGIHPSAQIMKGAEIAEDVSIGPGVYIDREVVVESGVIIDPGSVIHGPSTIGSGSRIHARVTIMPCSTIGSECILHPGAVIGGDGFGFVSDTDGALRVPHRGGVVLGDRVEVGCLSTIDRGVLGNTTIGTGTKIDNLVHVAHNVSIGAHSFLAAQVGIAGSATIGNQCEFGGQSGMVGHAEIGDKVRVAAKSAILSGGFENETVMGIPATEAGRMRRIFAILQQLPELRDRILDLEKKLDRDS